jgi:hypothetical protein
MITDKELDIIISESLDTQIELFSEGLISKVIFNKKTLYGIGMIATFMAGYNKGSENQYHGPGLATGLALGVLLGAIWGAYRSLRKKFGSKCDGLIGEARKKCFQEATGNAIVKPLNLLVQIKSKCSESNNPEECKKRIDQKIKELKKQKL